MIRKVMSQSRRGFALPLVILLMLVSSMTIVVIMQRQTAQTRLVQEMINDYHTHHAGFGVRAIIRKWLQSNSSELSEYASEDEVSFRFILPGELYVSIWIEDGQGIPVKDPIDIGPANLDFYKLVTARIEQTRPGSLRAKGPSFISIPTAPEHVLRSLVEDEEDGHRIANRIIRARERKPLDRDEMMNQLRRAGMADEEIARVVAITTFDPVLWKVNVFSEDRKNKANRYFVMQADITAGSLAITSWEERIGVDPSDPFAEKPQKTNRDDDETADLNDDDQDNRNSDNDEDDDEDDKTR